MGKTSIFFKIVVLFQVFIGLYACGNAGTQVGDNNNESDIPPMALLKNIYTNYRGEPMNTQDYFTIIDYLDKSHHIEMDHVYSGLGEALVHNDGLIDSIIGNVSEFSSAEKKRIVLNGLIHCLSDYAKVYCERMNGEKPTKYIGIEECFKISSCHDNFTDNLKSIRDFKNLLRTNPDSLITVYNSSSFATIDSVLIVLHKKDIAEYTANDFHTIVNYFLNCDNEFGSEGIYYMLGEKMIAYSGFFNALIEMAKTQGNVEYRLGILQGVYDSLYSYGLMNTDSYSFPVKDNLDEIICRLTRLRQQLTFSQT